MVAGAAVGALGVMLTAFLLLEAADKHFVTRLEYAATLQSIEQRLDAIAKEARREIRIHDPPEQPPARANPRP